MLRKLAFFVCLVFIHQSESKLPSYFKPCAKSDTKFNQCAKRSAILSLPSILKGDRKYKIPALTPLVVPELTLEPGPNLKIKLSNMKIDGLEKAEIKDVNFNFKDKKFTVKVSSPELRMKSDYDINGRILVLPITGKGPMQMKWKNIILTYTLDYELYKKNGADYMRPKNANIVYDLEKMEVQLDNLFNGDKVLGTTTNQFLNENWKEANKELGPGIAEALAQIITSIIKGTVDITPFNEIFPEKV